MNWLLKIVDGPMKGAEIALVNGTRVTLGKGDACDIIIADASLADEAFSLDVAEGGVTLVRGDGSGISLHPFEKQVSGATAFAVGPAEGAWEEVREPAPAAPEGPQPEVVETPADSSAAETSPHLEAEGAAPSAPEEVSSKRRSHGLLWLFLFCLLLIVAGVLAWFFWPRIIERYPVAERLRVTVVEKVRSYVASDPARKEVAPAASPVQKMSLADIARDHHLKLSLQPYPCLSGNVKRRTERHAIRALALATDRYCRFDLSDDESFRGAAEALVYTVTEEAVKVTAATNRRVTVAGYAPDPVALASLEEAMRADIPWLESIDASQVMIGGAVPAGLLKSRFATTGQLVASEKKVVEKPVQKAERPKLSEGSLLPKSFLPVAGILTKPYPCVVLNDGHRLVEGAKVGDMEILAIASDRITLRYGEIKVVWMP